MTRRKSHRSYFGVLVLSIFVILNIAPLLSCNVFAPLDRPMSDAEKLERAKALANEESDCEGAKNLLLGMTTFSDDALVALGWAYMCIAGAKAANIASSIYSYSGSSSNLEVLGILARTMLPMDVTKLDAAQSAVSVFDRIQNDNIGSLQVGIARFVQAAAILANQAVNVSGVADLTRGDISNNSCSGFSCTGGGVAAACPAGMSASQVTQFISVIQNAAANLGTAGASDLKGLADAINAGIAGSTDGARCFIFNQTIPSS